MTALRINVTRPVMMDLSLQRLQEEFVHSIKTLSQFCVQYRLDGSEDARHAPPMMDFDE